MSHFRFRSVPGRLRLSRMLTCQPSSIIRMAALTPRNPAPSVMRTRRAGPREDLGAARVLERGVIPASARSVVEVIEGTYLKTITQARLPTIVR